MAFNSSIRNTLHAALGALLLLPALLQAEEAERWYQVEIIIFSQNSPTYQKSELWPRDYTLPQLEGSRELQAARSASRKVPFSLVPKSKLQLGATAQRISKASDVKLLLHTGWVQPGLPEEQAVAVHIYDGMLSQNSEGAPLPKLDGTLRLILSRYLHLESDLLLREPMPEVAQALPQPESPVGAATGASAISLSGGVPVAAGGTAAPHNAGPNYQVYRLEQSRRMRSGEVHHIDHPMFGIIAVVNRYDPSEGSAAGDTP